MKPMHRADSSSLIVGFVILVVTLLLSGGAAAAPTGRHASATQPSLGVSTCSNLLPSGAIQGTVSDVYDFLANNTNYQFGLSSGQLVYATQELFDTVCQRSDFAESASAAGFPHVTLEYEFVGGNAQYTNFTLTWMTANNGLLLDHHVYWSGNLSSGTISGPYSMATAPLPTYGSFYSHSQAGYDFWWSVGGTLQTFWRVAAYTQVVQMTNPGLSTQKNVPPGTAVDAEGAAWVGTSPQSTEGGGLLQTGYAYDASNPSSSKCTGAPNGCDNGLWYEYLPSPPQPYSGNPTVPVGAILDEQVQNAGSGYWDAMIYDYSNGHTYPASVYVGSYAPRYAYGIMEAPSYLGVVQQIAQFQGSPVDFEYGTVQTTSSCRQSCVLWDSLYAVGTYDQTVLNQEQGVTNTNANQASCGGMVGGGTVTCYQMKWLSSLYDYNCVNLQGPNCHP